MLKHTNLNEKNSDNLMGKINNKNKVRHDMRLYRIWCGMKQRCYNPNDKKHKYYYDKGIGICDKWKDNFTEFYNWAINNGYNDSLTIDRIDNSKGYYPENCRWATYKQQNNNRSNTKKVIYNNIEYLRSEFCEVFKINESTLRAKLKRGMTVEEIVTSSLKGSDNIC